jgi:hypothetical protein
LPGDFVEIAQHARMQHRTQPRPVDRVVSKTGTRLYRRMNTSLGIRRTPDHTGASNQRASNRPIWLG